MSSPFSVGDEVWILRSNGQKQQVSISRIKDDGNILVEWTEGNESKGKEVSITQLDSWNERIRENKKTKILQEVTGKKRKATSSDLTEPPASKIGRPPRITLDHQKENKIPVRNTIMRRTIVQSSFPQPVSLDINSFPETTSMSNSKFKRKGSCVMEINRITENRQERRKKQEESTKTREKFAVQNNTNSQNVDFLTMIEDYRDELPDTDISYNQFVNSDLKISVCVRKRPMNERESSRKEIDVITIPSSQKITVHECKLKVDLTKYLDNLNFFFDYVFNENCENDLVYMYTARPLVNCFLAGGHATCFAYGQTGSGKTYTMIGDPNNSGIKGIYQYTVDEVFNMIKSPEHKNLVLFVSFFEIYGTKVHDLLDNKKSLRILEDGNGQVQVCELTEYNVKTPQEAFKLIQEGSSIRSSGKTSANMNSSRSHSIFQFILKKKAGPRSKKFELYGKFSLVDLAGNERGVDTTTCDRQTRMEGAEINKSLLALKECIRALNKKGFHLPFRASKLTHVLRDSFISDSSRTCMIANISPGINSCENTLNTLRYADRVKEIEGSDKRDDSKSTASVGILDGDVIDSFSHKENIIKYQNLVDEILNMKEDLVEEHKNSYKTQENKKWLNQEKDLLDLVENGDLTIEEYISKLDEIVNIKIQQFSKLHEKLERVKIQLTEEEEASRKVKRLLRF